MSEKKITTCFEETGKGANCCKIESLVTVDVRGQMVLPKEIREKADIRPGDKLALISWEREGRICCVSLVKAEDLGDMVKGFLGPMMKDMVEPSPGR